MATNSVSTNNLDQAYVNQVQTQKDAAKATSSDTSTNFLNMLITQLKNQDPLNPMDNAQVTSQLAQINTVTGIQQLNTTMKGLVDTFTSGQTMQAAGMIGKTVLSPGKDMQVYKGVGIAGVQLDSAADQVDVSIMDKDGNVVAKESLKNKDAGSFSFAWDGKKTDGTTAADGNYTFAVSATQGGNKVTATALAAGTVSAVILGKTGFQLDLGTGTNLNFSDIKQIL